MGTFDPVSDAWTTLDPGVAFLNHGSFGACPAPVMAEQQRWREKMEREPVAFLEREIDDFIAPVRAAAASFLGADPDGLGFVSNATTGVNTVLRGIGLHEGDEVVTTAHAYPAVGNAIEEICRQTGARAIRVDSEPPWPGDIAARISSALTDRTALVVIDHITSPTAAILPVEEIVAGCRARGVPVLVDAAHAPAMLPVEIDELGADFWTGNFHKWLCAPKGAGALWVAPAWRERIRPLVISQPWLTTFRARFDWTGTDDWSAVLSVPTAIEFLGSFGWDAIRERNHALIVEGRALVCEAIGVEPLVPDDACGWMATVPLPAGIAGSRDEARALNARLFEEFRVEAPFNAWNGHTLLRLSAHLYNSLDDFRRLADALPRLLS